MSNSSNQAPQPEPLQYELLDTPESGRELQPLEWRVRVHRRARNLSLQVEPNGSVRVTVPPRTRPGDVAAFVQENVGWIAKAQSYYAQRVQHADALPGDVALRALNRVVHVDYQRCPEGARSGWEQSGDLLRLRSTELHPDACWPLLRGWLKSIARDTLVSELNDLSNIFKLKPKKVQIRLQKSRWGSCSSLGTISLNAALLLQPPEQVRYLLVHELCHLRHLNHSRRYWALVARHVPDYKRLDQALSEAWQQTPLWLLR